MIVNYLKPHDGFGVLGDTRGNLDGLLAALDFFRDSEVDLVIALGSFGWPAPIAGNAQQLERISAQLRHHRMMLFFLDGEHDWLPRLAEMPVSADGVRWVADRVGHLPRGSGGDLFGGLSFAAMGGAGSIDVHERTAGLDWWREEIISEQDLDVLTDEHADVLFGHDAPLDLLGLDPEHDSWGEIWGREALAWNRLGRTEFDRAVDLVTPKLTFGSHYRHFNNELVGRWSERLDRGYRMRAVTLDAVDGPGASRAIIDLPELTLRFYDNQCRLVVPPPQAIDLTAHAAGRWRIHTLGSQHVIDLDARTVQRIPGPGSARGHNDGTHRLWSVERCEIGRPGLWMIASDDPDIEYFWHRSSIIRHIEPLDQRAGDAERADG